MCCCRERAFRRRRDAGDPARLVVLIYGSTVGYASAPGAAPVAEISSESAAGGARGRPVAGQAPARRPPARDRAPGDRRVARRRGRQRPWRSSLRAVPPDRRGLGRSPVMDIALAIPDSIARPSTSPGTVRGRSTAPPTQVASPASRPPTAGRGTHRLPRPPHAVHDGAPIPTPTRPPADAAGPVLTPGRRLARPARDPAAAADAAARPTRRRTRPMAGAEGKRLGVPAEPR